MGRKGFTRGDGEEGLGAATGVPGGPTTPKPLGFLSVELVPSSCWFSNVRSEVPKPAWEALKRHVSRRAAHRCEICGGRGYKWPVECHEIFEYNDEEGVQRLSGLQALCPSCHEVKHIGFAFQRGRGERALAKLSKVNGWSADDAKVYVEVAFEVWSRRSRRSWTLDLTGLQALLVEAGSDFQVQSIVPHAARGGGHGLDDEGGEDEP